MRLGIIGCGAIGSVIARAVDKGVIEAELAALYDKIVGRCAKLAESLRGPGPRVCRSFEEFLDTGIDVAVEAASQEAVRQYVAKLLGRGIDVVVLSVGALLDNDVLRMVKEESRRARLYIPSGAVPGVDAVKAAALAGISRVVLVTRKNPRSVSPKALERLGVGGGVEEARVVFEGPAEEAVRVLPFNINVAATLKLASGAPVHVRFIVDPGVERNTHEIIVESRAARIHIVSENVPHPENRKTSYIAALSAIQLLRQISGGRLIVGT